MKAKVTVISSTPTRENLKNVYDVCNKLFSKKDVFYSSEQVEEFKKDCNNFFL